MNSERYQQVTDVFHKLVDLPADEWQLNLDRYCGQDEALRNEVLSLLRSDRASNDFLETSALAPRQDQTGQFVGKYEVEHLIGEGGMGAVYVAWQASPIRRRVALKRIRAGFLSPELLTRFHAERDALARLNHPYIAQVFDAGVAEDGTPYLAMELVEGVSIVRYCHERQVSWSQKLALFCDVCQAVAHAHDQGVLHRDLKPSNILVLYNDGKPIPKVIDFGLAKALGDGTATSFTATNPGMLLGTLPYLSPEQASMGRERVGRRADIYSLGILLYELVTGATPFPELSDGGLPYMELLKIIREKPIQWDAQPVVLRGQLRQVLQCALQKDPANRYASVAELAAAVEAVSVHDVAPRRQFLPRLRWELALILTLLAALAATFFWSARRVQALGETQRQSNAATTFLRRHLLTETPSSIDRAAARLATDAAADPLVEAMARESIASAYLNIGELSKAAQQLDRAIEIRSRLQGEGAAETIAARKRRTGIPNFEINSPQKK